MRNYVELQIKSLFFILLYFQKYLNEKKYEKFNPNFFCFAKSPILFYKIYERARLIMDGNSGIKRSHKVPLF